MEVSAWDDNLWAWCAAQWWWNSAPRPNSSFLLQCRPNISIQISVVGFCDSTTEFKVVNQYNFLSIAEYSRHKRVLFVCLSVCLTCDLRRNGWTDRTVFIMEATPCTHSECSIRYFLCRFRLFQWTIGFAKYQTVATVARFWWPILILFAATDKWSLSRTQRCHKLIFKWYNNNLFSLYL